MAEIRPFRGVLYDTDKAGDISSVVAPPYDIISPEQQEELHRRNPLNVIRLILGKEYPGDSEGQSKYSRAAELWEKWLSEGILIEDPRPALYVLCDQYRSIYGDMKSRIGFISAVRIERPGDGSVKPHEGTLDRPKADRLNLIRAVKANLSPIFSMYSDPEFKVDSAIKDAISGTNPLFDFTDTGSVERMMWRITDEGVIGHVISELSDRNVFIADGHHRYETSLNFMEELDLGSSRPESDSHRYVMMYLANAEDDALSIFPSHRVIRNNPSFSPDSFLDRAGNFFDILNFGSSGSEAPVHLVQEIAEVRKDGRKAFGLCLGNDRFYVMILKQEISIEPYLEEKRSKDWQELDTAVVHYLIIRQILGDMTPMSKKDELISYEVDPVKAANMVISGGYQIAILLNPTEVKQVKAVAENREKMPPKSTYFYPKLITGLVMRKIF